MTMNKLRIGIVGLGNIAQKVYLPFLSKEMNWSLVGAYSPTENKRKELCCCYRIKEFSNLSHLISECDAVFVHSSTASHFEIISQALKKGKDVYVDKPLASTLEEAEQLVELSIQTGRKLMVGFNRRFAPMYVKARQEVNHAAWIRMEKHRVNGVGLANFEFTMLDDYIHLVDTARWLGEPLGSIMGWSEITADKQLLFAQHGYKSVNNAHISIGMHRKTGTNLEQLEFVALHSVVRIKNMDTMEIEKEGSTIISISSSWESIIKRRGFEDSIMHFIHSVIGDTRLLIDGEEGLKTQKLVHDMIQQVR
jgi:virulence factor